MGDSRAIKDRTATTALLRPRDSRSYISSPASRYGSSRPGGAEDGGGSNASGPEMWDVACWISFKLAVRPILSEEDSAVLDDDDEERRPSEGVSLAVFMMVAVS